MHLLLESRLKGPRPVLGTVVSTATHMALFAALVLGGGRVVDELADAMQQSVRYLIPSDRVQRPPETKIEFAASPGSGVSAAVTVASRVDGSGASLVRSQPGSAGDAARTQLAVPEPTAAENAYSILDVDSAAVRDPASAAPSYPQSLADKQVEGSATIRFVVDSTGSIDLATVQVLRATNPMFARAVTDAMPGMRFRPAMAGDKAVRQLAEQEFKFRLQHADASAPLAPAKKP